MSDFEDDIDDQLLELAGATEKKRRRRQQHSGSGGGGGGGGKKRKERDSERESEDEREREDPYPLEGKYKNEADKRELLAMTEFQREQILEERAAEREKMRQNRALEDLVKQQQGGLGGAAGGGGSGGGGGGGGGEEESVSRAAKRQHTARGSTKEKTHKLDELKAKRKAKDDKKRAQGNASPSQRDRSSSPQDMDISDSESEDGQIGKGDRDRDREDERDWGASAAHGHAHGRGHGNQGRAPDSSSSSSLAGRRSRGVVMDAKSTMVDLEGCRLTRDALAKHCLKPWFQDYVTGAWVRYLIGQETNGQPVYRICQINNLAQDLVKPYKINEQTIDQAFELKHGKSIKIFNMDKVSNGPFLEKEYERLVKVCESEQVDMPTKQELEKKVAQMGKLVSQPMTESDVTSMLNRKAQLQGNKNSGMTTLQRSQLQQKRTLALRRQDLAEVAEVDAQLAEAGVVGPEPLRGPTDMLTKVNERNRKANMEAVRRAELQESERKRRERKMAQSGSGTPVPVDPSARLKIMPRTFNSTTPTTTRPGTPAVAAKTEVGGKGPAKPGSSFETALIDSIEIDLGDF